MSIEIALPLLFAAGLGGLVAHLWRRGEREERRTGPPSGDPGDRAGDWVHRVPRIFTQPHETSSASVAKIGRTRGAAPTGTARPVPDAPATAADGRSRESIDESPGGTLENRSAAEATDGRGEEEPVASGTASSSEPDDLTRIKGVGKVLEGRLHELGITTFEQLAALGPDDVARASARMGFGDRVERDAWIAQAGRLAAEKRSR